MGKHRLRASSGSLGAEMKKVLLLFTIGIAVIVMIIGGCVLVAIILDMKVESTRGCSPLPEGFTKDDLVGTWMAGISDRSDTLIINTEGTYKQIVYIKFADQSEVNYESEWQPWRLEYSEDNIGYLHLEGFRFCGMNAGIPCETRGGDGYDFCRDESIKMLNEGILLVLIAKVAQSPATEGVKPYVRLHYPLGSENSWVYFLQNP